MGRNRQGGEVLTLAMNAITPKGTTMGARIEQLAGTTFTAAMKSYRADHPRATT
jgi:hypothetical protein